MVGACEAAAQRMSHERVQKVQPELKAGTYYKLPMPLSRPQGHPPADQGSGHSLLYVELRTPCPMKYFSTFSCRRTAMSALGSGAKASPTPARAPVQNRQQELGSSLGSCAARAPAPRKNPCSSGRGARQWWGQASGCLPCSGGPAAEAVQDLAG